MKYITTFHSHFGALTYYRALMKRGVSAELMPVPRKLSASCGTCVMYKNDSSIDMDGCEIDALYCERNGVLECEVRK